MSNVVTLNGGANLTEKMKRLQARIEKDAELKEKRAEINAEIAANIAGAEADGVPRKAFRDAVAYRNLDVDKRQGYDAGYAFVREAAGLPLQSDLFSAATALAKDIDAKKEAAKPTAKEIADRQFEQATRNGKMKDAPVPAKKTEAGSNPPAPPAPNAAGIAEAMKKEDQANG